MNGLPALEYWEFALETLSCKPAGGKCGRHRCEELVSHPHLDNCVFEPIDEVPRKFTKTYTQFNTTYSKIMRTSQERTESIWIGCLR